MTKQEIDLFYAQFKKVHEAYIASTPESKPKQLYMADMGRHMTAPNELTVSYNVRFVLKLKENTLELVE